jgi:hypothetical protein
LATTTSININKIENKTLNHELNNILTWSKLGVENFNLQKTKAMLYSNVNRNRPNLYIDNVLLNLIARLPLTPR